MKDKDDIKKNNPEDIELRKQIEKQTSLDWNNVFSKIISPGSNKEENMSIFGNEEVSSNTLKNKISKSNVDLSPIMYEIGKYKFSSINTQKEVEQIAISIRDIIKKKIASKIVNNTKDICKYASDFYQTEDSIRGIFNILSNKYSMKVTGDFCGEEAIYCAAQGDQIVGMVLSKDDKNEYIDISNKFNIEINKV